MIAKSVSVKVFTILAAFAAMLAASLLCGVPQAHAASYSYVERHWDGARVAQVTKTANCYVIDDDTSVLENGAWYVVNSKVNSNERLIVKGTANIILCDGARLYLEDGINVPAGKTLNIYGQGGDSGELYCDADTNDNAAIGANDEKGACGTINFHGGKVTANTKDKGTDGAGIGGGDEGDGGNVTIYGGEVTAIGAGLGAGIGGGDRDGNKGGNNGTTTIYGGTVKATGGSSAAGIGGGELGSGGTVVIKGGDVTATGGTDAAGIGGGMKGSGGTITIEGGKVNATGGSANSNGGAGIGGGGAGSSGTITIHDGNVTARGGANAAGIGGGDEGSAGTITITGGTVNATGGSVNYDGGAGIGGGNGKGGGEVTIRGGNVTAQGGCDAAGIGGGDGGAGGTVYVINGTVNATGGKYGAGIGGGQDFSGNTIRIQGGTVNAKGGSYGAGLGGGQRGNGGTITITDGTVTATGGTDSAGIGGGEDGNGGSINIQRGSVTAYGGAGGAGIGGGDGVGATNAGNSGDITISGGEVTATGGAKGAGLGGGNSGDNDNKGTIAISGGKVIATGGGQDPNDENPEGAAGIGGGNAQSGGTIQITGGDVTARASYRSAGIGGGGEATGGNITITGGTVKAYGGAQGKKYSYIYPEGGAGIGGGYKNDGGTITIGGDVSVMAHGTEGAAGIGGGRQGKSGTIVINDGTVDASTGHGGAGIGSGFICRDSGTTVNVTINGGTVKAVGGESLLQTDSEVGKYFWSHPGAGIGAGGCSDYMQKEDREYHSYFTGSINLNGGTIDAFVGKNDDGLSNAAIGGIELGDTATITVKGGCTVKVHQNGANDPGKALLKAKEVKLEDEGDKSSCVRNLTNPSDIASTNERVAWCQRENSPLELLIEPCKHEGASYTHDESNHSMTCPHCTRSYSEAHEFGKPEWIWMAGYESATVKIVCACGYAPEATATITKNHSEGNTTTGTQDTFTAKATINGKEYTEVEVGPQAQIAILPSAVQGLVYDGRGHALVTGGAASAGTMQYQLGTSDDTVPTGEWSNTIPTGTNAGTYYVWSCCYMGKDGLVSTTTPQCVTVTIAKAPSPVKVADNATVKVGGGKIKLEDYVKTNGATGAVAFADQAARDANCSITSESNGTYFTSGNSVPESTVPVTVTVAADDNYEALAATDINVNVTSDTVLVISADDVTTTYVEGGHVSIPNVQVLAEGGVEPTGDYGGIIYPTDPPVGNQYLRSASDLSNDLTILQAGTTYVTVSTGGRNGYAFAYKDVKVTINKANITPSVTLEDWTYGDTAKMPVVSGNPGEGEVTYEYKAKDADNITYTTTVPTQAGAYTVRATVPETDNYEGNTCTDDFTIVQRNVTVAADNKSSKYEEELAELTYSLDGSTTLAEVDSIESLGITASTTATNKSTIGNYPITLTQATANPNYNVTLVEGTYTIAKNDPVVVAPVPRNLTYSSKPQTLVSSGFATGGTIQFSLDGETFSDDMPAGTNAGNYDVWYRVAGDANHSDIEPRQLTATIAPANISGATVELAQQSFVYDGSAKEPAITITLDDMTLGKDDYSVSYSANTDAGEAIATITGMGNYTGTAIVGFEIAAVDISKATVELAQDRYVADGKAKEPAAKVTLGGRELVAGTDYEVIYANNVDAGTATATVTGKGNYVGSAEATFAIAEDSAPMTGGVTMHRLYNPNSGEHFFTASEYERDAVVAAGWTYEGEGWTAPESGDPVYRLYNPNAGEHHYTRSEVERDHLVSVGWKDEGTGWLSAGDDGVPLLRVYNPNAFANNHHYTASAAERDWLVSLGWKDEGTGWYGL